VIEHFEHPRHHGYFDAAADVIAARAGRRSDGVEFSFTARIAAERLVALRFQAFGCPHSIAAASWLTERLVGVTQQELAQWQWREAAQALEVPTEKRGRLLILEDAVHALAENWRRRAHNPSRTD
jgi:NifU-like protein involved in Fe-S cluster formation